MVLRNLLCRKIILSSPWSLLRIRTSLGEKIPTLGKLDACPKVCAKVLSTQPAIKNENAGLNIVVYEGPLRKRIKTVKLISLSTSFVASIVQPFVIFDVCKENLAIGIVAGVITAGFLATPLILHSITKRYVLELTFNPRTKIFTAKTFTLINKIREIKFTADDVSVPTLPGVLSSLLVKDTPLFVDSNLVKCPESYSHMMGYDKPIDFEFYGEKEK